MGMQFENGYVVAAKGRLGFFGYDGSSLEGRVSYIAGDNQPGTSLIEDESKQPKTVKIKDGSIKGLITQAKGIIGNGGDIVTGLRITTRVLHVNYAANGLDMALAKEMFEREGVTIRLTDYGFIIYDSAEDA